MRDGQLYIPDVAMRRDESRKVMLACAEACFACEESSTLPMGIFKTSHRGRGKSLDLVTCQRRSGLGRNLSGSARCLVLRMERIIQKCILPTLQISPLCNDEISGLK